MQIKDLTDKKPVDEIILSIKERRKPRVAGTTVVQPVEVVDETGDAILNLWGEDIKKFEKAVKVKVTKGFATEYKEKIQISAGKFGKTEELTDATVVVNKPAMSLPKKQESTSDFMQTVVVKNHIEFCVSMNKDWLECFAVEKEVKPQSYIDWAKSEDGGNLKLDDGQLIVLYNYILAQIKVS